MNAPLWLSNLAFWSVQVALLVLVAALLIRLLRIRQPRILLIHWRVLLFVSLILPFLQPWHRPPAIAAIPAVPATPFLHVIPSQSPSPSPWHLPGFLLVAQILAVVILVGIFVRFAILLLGLFKLSQFRRASSPIPAHAEPAALLQRICILVGARAEFRLSSQVDSPVTFGVSAPVILLPERFLHLDQQFQSAIACHELLHVRRRDWAHHLAEEILRAAFWFHPAILWLVSRTRLAREQVVDLSVISLTQARKPYLQALLEFAASRNRIAAIPAPPFLVERQLVERAALMLKEVRMSRTRLIASLSAIACSLAAAAVLATDVFPLKAAPLPLPNSAQTSTASTTSAAATQPVVDQNSIWTAKVKKGSMPIMVRGLGVLALLNGQNVAKVDVGELLAADIRAGQSAQVDTHKGIVNGHVTHISSSVIEGNRSVYIALDSALPAGLDAHAQVEGTITIGNLVDVVYVGRPVHVPPGSQGAIVVPVFKIIDNGREAQRLNVQFGRVSVSTIQVLSGLKPGDTIILSDMSPYDKFARIQIKR